MIKSIGVYIPTAARRAFGLANCARTRAERQLVQARPRQ
jgi:hypothetical protein